MWPSIFFISTYHIPFIIADLWYNQTLPEIVCVK